MLKRLLFLFIILTSLISLGYSSTCSFDLDSNDCKKFTEPFNNFNLEFSQATEINNFEVSIFNKENPSNIIQTQVLNNQIRNIVPFTESGVYTLRVEFYNNAQIKSEKEFDFVFDNSKPFPPLVNLNLTSNTNSYLLEGSGDIGSKILGIREDLTEFQTDVDSNGNYQLSLSLNEGLNYFRFYTVNSNGIKSEPLERIINFDNSLTTNSDATTFEIENLLQNNFRTYIENEKYITSKRNFLISGKAPESERGKTIYVNGNPAFVDNSLNFGAFILLNEGINEISVETDSEQTTFEVIYLSPRFKFEQINVSKVISSDLEISGKTNLDLSFNLYINGEFKEEIIPSNTQFDYSTSDLKVGKNYIYLQGLNSESYSQIVYKDNLNPTIELLTPERIAYLNNLVFKITDDTGIDSKNLEIKIGEKIFTSDNLNISSDFYTLDVSTVENGIHDYSITVTDRAGNSKSLSGVISIDNDNTLIERFNLREGYFIGNSLFIKKGENQIILSPSRYIAFEKIYLDGVEQNNYEIKENSNVYLNLDFENKEGELELFFVNSDLDSSSFLVKYYTDEEKPKVELDYIQDSYAKENGIIKVSGEIIDSHFDYSSLNFNSQSNFLRFGNYFEAYVKENGGNLEISGRDFSFNEIENGIFGGLIEKDIRTTDLEISNENSNSNSLSGALKNNNANIKNFVYEYDGFNTQNSYLGPNFNLPTNQRTGLRSLNLKGIEQSNMKFNNIKTISIGNPIVNENSNVAFKIYFTGNDKYTKESNYFIQGQVLTSSDLTSVKIGDKNCEFDAYNFVCFVNLNSGENTFEIIAKNENTETTSDSYSITRVENDIENSITDVSGYGVFKSGSIYFINLNLLDLQSSVSKETINKLVIDSREVLIGKKTGEFNIAVNLEDNLYGKNTDEIEISLKSQDEYGNEGVSNKITLVYNRVLQTILKIIVG